MQWKLVILTDLVLILSTGNDPRSSDRYIELDRNSLVKDLPDSKYFGNLFSITGVNAGETFQAGNKEEKFHVMSVLDHTIAMIGRNHPIIESGRIGSAVLKDSKKEPANGEKQQNRKIEVHVVGTEQRLKDGKKRTYYIILISLGSERFHKCFKRHSEIRQLHKLLSQIYPKRAFPNFEKNSNLLKTFCTKTVEMRKLVIENFFQLILKDAELRSCQIIQDFIKFPVGFLESQQRTCEYNRVSGTSNFNNIRSAKEALTKYSEVNLPIVKDRDLSRTTSKTLTSLEADKKNQGDFPTSQGQIIRSYSEKREDLMTPSPDFDLFLTASETKPSKEKLKNNDRKRTRKVYDVEHLKHNIAVYLLNGFSFEFKIDSQTNAKLVCEQLSARIGLDKHDDFRLFLVEGNGKERPLDADECIIEAMSLSDKNDEGILRKMTKSVMNIFREHTQQKLIFKKYYYLPQHEEYKLCQNDNVRLDLLISQALIRIKENCDNFDHDKIVAIMCLSTFNKYFDEILREGALNWFQDVDKKLLFQFVSESVLKMKPRELWKTALQSYWKVISSEIELNRTARINDGFPHEEVMINLKIILKYKLLSLLSSHCCYGVNFYKAKVYNPSEETSSRNWPSTKFFLGIKFGELFALSRTKSKCPLICQLKDVVDIKCYPVSIKLIFLDYEIRLDTKKSFEIQQLIETYKKQQEALNLNEEGKKELIVNQNDLGTPNESKNRTLGLFF